MKKMNLFMLVALFLLPMSMSAQNEYTQRFLDLRAKMNDPANGYFSADGVPYHSVETLMAEAPDHGHETTSEAYSYWIWMEAMYGGISGDWAPLNNAWSVMETKAIPTSAQQPTTGSYDPGSPATYAGEYPLPSGYPSPLETDVPVGQDPVSAELTAAYGSDIYAMHWLFDCDNFYGYGNLGDGVSTPSYINTFQRGEQESVWETVPHPSWEDFSWGNDDGTGFLKLFIDDPNPAKQWRYTNAPDADARAVQAMYWAVQFAKEQGKDPASTIPTAKASKMGDFVRLAMFDKYFKPIGVQDKMGAGGTGYQSAHYLMSWYFAWGGPLTENGWAWRIGSSHSHFGYQNPVAAYALSELDELKPITPNGSRDWGASMQRQLEFYTWLQSDEGAIAGGATNSLNGNYSAYPAGTATFYDMAYQEHPVYHDPGSNQWIGMQAWSMERIAELYYISNNTMAKNLMDKWIVWIKSEVQLTADGNFNIPATLAWTGQPNTWDPANPTPNTNLHVTVTDYGKDLGIAACLAKAITYYAAATEKYGALDTEARDLAKEILDRMWNNYYEPDGLGVAVEETRGDFSRFFDQEVYVPNDFVGKMANGDVIQTGVKFIDIRSKYRDDPAFPTLEAAYNAGEDYTAKFHRYWAQADIALANAEYGRLFGENDPVAVDGVTVDPNSLVLSIGQTSILTAVVSPFNASNKAVSWTSSAPAIASVDANGSVTAEALGAATITVTTEEGGFTDACSVTVSTTPSYTLSVSTSGTGTVSLSPVGGTYDEGSIVTLTATAGAGFTFSGWSGDLTGTSNPVTLTMDANKVVTASFTEIIVGECAAISLPWEKDGADDVCFTTTGDITFVNSWNMTLFEINGVDFTNKWSNTMPPKIDGKYNIKYVSTVAWSHAEINGSGGGIIIPPIQYTLTANTVGQGSIALSPAGGTYDEGTPVSVTATAAAGYEFSGWSGALSGSANPTSVTMDANKTITATFTEVINPPTQYTLTTSIIGQGSIALSPAGGTYDEGTPVSVTATAAAGYEFSGWSGALSGSANPASVTMDANKTVTATFSEIINPPVTVQVDVIIIGEGTVNLNPAGNTYEVGTIVTISAVPATGWVFESWSGDLVGSGNPQTFTANNDMTVTVTFVESPNGGDCDFDAPLATALPTISNATYENVHVIGDGPDLSNIRNFTINWGLANNGLWQFSVNTTNGQPNWYVDLRSSLTQSFNQPSPDAVFSGSGFTGLDGEYWVTLDGANFVLVEKSSAYAIYFSNSATAPCTSLKSGYGSKLTQPAFNFTYYPNPVNDFITVEFDGEITGVLEIRNMSGNIVYAERLQSSDLVKIDLTDLATGMYIITTNGNSIKPKLFTKM